MIRFIRYAGLGIVTFSIDLALLFMLTDVVGLYYLWSTAIAFAIAATLNYALSRLYVFPGSARSLHSGYAISILIALGGLAAITALMYLFVHYLEINYLISRVIIAALVGGWGYFMNLRVNFKLG